MQKSTPIKEKIEHILNDEHHAGIGRVVNLFMATLIVINVLCLILETVPEYSTRYPEAFSIFEVFSVIVFTIEYLLRFWVSPDKRAFFLAPMSLIDLAAILPFYLPFVHVDFRFLRSIRLLRLLRILKLVRYSKALQTLLAVIVNKRHELLVSASFGALMLVLTSSGIYFLENPVQPDKFSSIPDAMWWSVVTLTTVGYGDIYPITFAGRILGGFTAFFGIGMFALPAGILASGFSEMIQDDEENHFPRVLINIDVNNLEKAVDFYEKCFHLTIGRRFGDDVVELKGLRSPIYLLAQESGSEAFRGAGPQGPVRNFSRHWTPVHLDFVVSHLETALERARRAGAVVESEIRTTKWGKIVLLSDPFGNGLCLIEFLGRGYDEIATND